MVEEKIGFGFQSDEDESLKAKDFTTFGLNTGKLTKFEYAPASKDDSGKEFLENISIEIDVNGSTLKQWWYPVNKVFGKDGGEIEDTTSPEYIKGFNEQMKHFKSVMTHYLKIKYNEAELAAAFSTPINSFKDFGEKLTTLMKPVLGTTIDVFLQYQWNIKTGATRTFLELPKNLKDGSFLTAHITPVGSWKEVRNEEGLSYVDDANNVHRFKRSKSYLETPKAVQQIEGETPQSAAGISMNSSMNSAQPAKW